MNGIKNIKKKLKGFQVRPPNTEVIKKVLLHRRSGPPVPGTLPRSEPWRRGYRALLVNTCTFSSLAWARTRRNNSILAQ